MDDLRPPLAIYQRERTMANKTATLYIRSAEGYALPSKKLVGLSTGETYILWYEGCRKRPPILGRDPGVAQIAPRAS